MKDESAPKSILLELAERQRATSEQPQVEQTQSRPNINVAEFLKKALSEASSYQPTRSTEDEVTPQQADENLQSWFQPVPSEPNYFPKLRKRKPSETTVEEVRMPESEARDLFLPEKTRIDAELQPIRKLWEELKEVKHDQTETRKLIIISALEQLQKINHQIDQVTIELQDSIQKFSSDPQQAPTVAVFRASLHEMQTIEKKWRKKAMEYAEEKNPAGENVVEQLWPEEAVVNRKTIQPQIETVGRLIIPLGKAQEAFKEMIDRLSIRELIVCLALYQTIFRLSEQGDEKAQTLLNSFDRLDVFMRQKLLPKLANVEIEKKDLFNGEMSNFVLAMMNVETSAELHRDKLFADVVVPFSSKTA